MKVLVTGGAGFIGSHLAERLVGDGHEVVVLDNLSSGHRANLASVERRLRFVEGDIRDAARLSELATGCELVFHQAAIVSVPYSVEHPQESHDVNIQGTFNVLQAARACGVRRVMFACSAAVYGEDPRLPKVEEMAPAPVSPYGVEKITGEYYLGVFNQIYGVETVSLRYFNVFGPRQDPRSPYSGVISVFVDRALTGATALVFGDGEQCRDFVYVQNVVDANLLAATVPAARGRCFNVGCGERTSLNELVAILGRLAGRPLQVEHREARAGDIRASVADIGRARSELGYAPVVGVDEGLRRLLEFERAKRR
ncbi:MAG: SDR family oxidoreductase [Deltaproteobacteria bacterium]|nr:SDR family oxidoreductase [Deltaproteobacteria bacterium]